MPTIYSDIQTRLMCDCRNTAQGDVFYVDVIAEGFQSQKVKRCQVVLWERNVVKGGYYEMHEWSSFVLTAPKIYGDDASLWPGLK